MFEKIEVDEENFVDPQITETNMVHYLGMVEDKANSILKVCCSFLMHGTFSKRLKEANFLSFIYVLYLEIL